MIYRYIYMCMGLGWWYCDLLFFYLLQIRIWRWSAFKTIYLDSFLRHLLHLHVRTVWQWLLPVSFLTKWWTLLEKKLFTLVLSHMIWALFCKRVRFLPRNGSLLLLQWVILTRSKKKKIEEKIHDVLLLEMIMYSKHTIIIRNINIYWRQVGPS